MATESWETSQPRTKQDCHPQQRSQIENLRGWEDAVGDGVHPLCVIADIVIATPCHLPEFTIKCEIHTESFVVSIRTSRTESVS